MTCKEFKNEFKNLTLLAFVVSDRTYIYKFNSNHITFFLRTFVEEDIPHWNYIMFYKIKNNNNILDENGKVSKFEEKADFLYVIAKKKDQSGPKCKFRRVLQTPDLSKIEGKKVKIFVIQEKK